MAQERPSFALVLRPEPGVDPVPALRALLKRALRDHGLKCLKLAEMPAAWRKFNGGRPEWDAAIAADEARLPPAPVRARKPK